MADHGELEYATAEGNDLPAHEATYEDFTHFVVIGTVLVITIVVGLAIGGVVGNWAIAATAITAKAVVMRMSRSITRRRPPALVPTARRLRCGSRWSRGSTLDRGGSLARHRL